MWTYWETRERWGQFIYRVESWYLFGFITVYSRKTLLSVPGQVALPTEKTNLRGDCTDTMAAS